METINKLGGRKLVLAFISLVVGVVVYFIKGIDANFLGLLLGIPGLFSVGNAAEYIAGAMGSRADAEVEASRKDNSEVIEQLIEQNNALINSVALVQQTLSYIITATGLDKPQQVAQNEKSNK